jgi:hypothetical protein
MALLGRAIVFILFDRAPGTVEDFYTWHDGEHIPERLAIPGFLRGRRFHIVGDGPQFMTLYEAADINVLTGPDYLYRLNHPTPLSRKVGPLARNNSRGVCSVIKSITNQGTGSAFVLIRFTCHNLHALEHQLSDLESILLNKTGFYGLHLCATSYAASTIEVEEKKNREIAIPESFLLIEGNQINNILSIANQIIELINSKYPDMLTNIEKLSYLLEVTHSKPQ